MRHLILVCLSLLFLTSLLSSCKTCAECECVNTHDYTIDDSAAIDETFLLISIQFLEEQFDQQFPEDAEAFCDKRKEVENQIDAYKEQSFATSIPGFDFTYSFSHDCSCDVD